MKYIVSILASLMLFGSFMHIGVPNPAEGASVWIEYDVILDDGPIMDLNGNVTWENMSVLVDSNVNVMGNLTIMNCTLHMNGWDLRNLGTIKITDIDGNKSTSGDGTRVIDISGFRSGIYDLVADSGFITIERSFLDGIEISGYSIQAFDLECLNSSLRALPVDLPKARMSGLYMLGKGYDYGIRSEQDGASIGSLNIRGYVQGISVIDSIPDKLENITISNCSIGLNIDHGNDTGNAVVVDDSIFINNTLHLYSNHRIQVTDSLFNGSGRLEFKPGAEVNIVRNKFLEISGLWNATGGTVIENEFTFCSSGLNFFRKISIYRNDFKYCGIAINDDMNCTIFHNVFKDNERDAQGFVRSTWYNKTTFEGNYFKGYKGKDDGSGGRRAGDGIGDTNVPHLGRDPYPLMNEDHWNMPRIPDLESKYAFGSESIRLDWEQVGADGFILQRSTSKDFSITPRTWSLNGPGFSVDNNPNTTVHFRIRSYNKYGSRGWSLPVSVSVDQRPLPPSSIEVIKIPEGNELEVNWQWVGEDIHKALVYYGPSNDSPRLKESFYPLNYVVIDDLDNGVMQKIRIQTIDSNGLSSTISDPIYEMAEDSVPPPPPRDLRADPLSNTSIVLNWNPPLIQDIGSYRLYRRTDEMIEAVLLANLSKSVYTYQDTGLDDNTTYYYSMSSVDDDGPISHRGEEVSVRTLHYNSAPYFVGRDQIIQLIEDEGPGFLDLVPLFKDDDGDELDMSINEYFPFKADIIDGILWVRPDPDQSGEGYVEIRVSDGEVAQSYLIGILVESRPDPPRDVRILSPLNGSVSLPGSGIKLQGQAVDPDMEQGERLHIIWRSDVDGILHESFQGDMDAVVELTPGRHLLSFSVEDETSNIIVQNVSIMVSLWGWGGIPWSVDLDDSIELSGENGGSVELEIDNQGPFVLRFAIGGRINGEITQSISERLVLVGPSSVGTIFLALPEGSISSRDVTIELVVVGETMNGTFAGRMNAQRTITINDKPQDEDMNLLIPLVVIFSTLALIGAGIYLFISNKKSIGKDGKV